MIGRRKERAVSADANGAILSTSRIHKRFGALVVLDAIDFSLRSKGAIDRVRLAGAGKTPLLNALAGAHAPRSVDNRLRGLSLLENAK